MLDRIFNLNTERTLDGEDFPPRDLNMQHNTRSRRRALTVKHSVVLAVCKF